MQRLQYAMDLEEKTSVSHLDRVEIVCYDVSFHKYESNDAVFNHNLNW